jgi:hypothetical protein
VWINWKGPQKYRTRRKAGSTQRTHSKCASLRSVRLRAPRDFQVRLGMEKWQ